MDKESMKTMLVNANYGKFKQEDIKPFDTKEREIEEMAQVFCGGEKRGFDCECCDACSGYYIAHQLVNAGYGNIKQAVKEFADICENIINNMHVTQDQLWAIKQIRKQFRKLYGEEDKHA